MTASVRFLDVSKRFRKGFRYRSLREDLALLGGRLVGRTPPPPETFAALDGVSFDVAPGESLGIVGSNGAGKSTTLKLIARVTYPDQGSIQVRGRVAALLEVSAGLHPELTGRDNVFMNGAILGMSRREVERKYDSIVEFAELGGFMDMPVKRFSSGMYVRLGFSVAAHTEPDVLLVDEVLSVGDMAFQAKSFDRMMAFRRRGATLVFVSHYLPAVAQMCERVLWIEHGRVRALGDTATVLEAYQVFQDQRIREAQSATELQGRDMGTGEVVIERITTHRADGSPAEVFHYQEPLLLRIHYRAFREVERPYFVVEINHPSGPLFTASMYFDDQRPERLKGSGVVELQFGPLPLRPGSYQVIGQIGLNVDTSYFRPRPLASFAVSDPPEVYGGRGTLAAGHTRTLGPLVVAYEWRLPG